jgi:hypothetical protein
MSDLMRSNSCAVRLWAETTSEVIGSIEKEGSRQKAVGREQGD